MSKFITLKDSSNPENKILVNIDKIAYIKKFGEGSQIYMDGSSYITVQESIEQVFEFFQQQTDTSL